MGNLVAGIPIVSDLVERVPSMVSLINQSMQGTWDTLHDTRGDTPIHVHAIVRAATGLISES